MPLDRWGSMEEDLRRFEREEFGTNDFPEIIETIRDREWKAAQSRMTGMDEEQADWDADEE